MSSVVQVSSGVELARIFKAGINSKLWVFNLVLLYTKYLVCLEKTHHIQRKFNFENKLTAQIIFPPESQIFKFPAELCTYT
jgi:hypothetical protein